MIKNFKKEIKKVDWPTRQKVLSLTGVVLVVVVFMSFFVFVVDMILGILLVK